MNTQIRKTMRRKGFHKAETPKIGSGKIKIVKPKVLKPYKPKLIY